MIVGILDFILAQLNFHFSCSSQYEQVTTRPSIAVMSYCLIARKGYRAFTPKVLALPYVQKDYFSGLGFR